MSEESREKGNANWRRYYEANKERIKARRKELYHARPKVKRDNSKQTERDKELRQTSEGWIRSALIHAKHRAKKKGLDFNLESSDVEWTTVCPVLGLDMVVGLGRDPRRNYRSPTLDRVDNDKGYIKGNVRIISSRANSLKSNATVEELEAVLKYMKEATNG